MPHSVVNVPGDYFSMAGFEVTTHGRLWVSPEDSWPGVPLKKTETPLFAL